MEQFADDLRSNLASRPIRLRQEEVLYRLRKFLRRRWLPVAAVTLALAGLCGGVIIAQRQRALAERRFQQVRSLANRLFDIDEKVQALPGSTAARQTIAGTSLEYLDRLSKEAGNDPALMAELATAYGRTASVLGRHGQPSLGKWSEALQALEKADGLLRAAVQISPQDRSLRRHFLRNRAELVTLRAMGQNYDGDSATRAVELSREVDRFVAGGPPGPGDLALAGGVYFGAANILLNGTRVRESRRLMDLGLDYRRRYAEAANTPQASLLLAIALRKYGTNLRYDGELDQAVAALEESLRIVEGLPEDARTLLERGNILYFLGVVRGEIDGLSLGQHKAAEAELAESINLWRGMVQADPKDLTARTYFAQNAQKLGRLVSLHDPKQGLVVIEEGLGIISDAPPGNVRSNYLLRLWCDSVVPLNLLGRQAQARTRLGKAMEILRQAKANPFNEATPTGTADVVLRAQAETEAEAGNYAKAIGIREETIRAYRAGKIKDEDDLQHALGLSNQWRDLADLYRKAGDEESARQCDAKRLAFWRAWNIRRPGNQFVLMQLTALKG